MLEKLEERKEFEMDLNRFCELNGITRRTAINWIRSGKLKVPNKILQGKRITNVLVPKDVITTACCLRKFIPIERNSLERLRNKLDKHINFLSDIKKDVDELMKFEKKQSKKQQIEEQNGKER